MTKGLTQDYLYSSRTSQLTKQYLLNPGPVLLITGPRGAGKYTLARAIAAALIGKPQAELDRQANIHQLVRVGNSSEISIDQVRQLKNRLRLKPGNRDPVQIILIDQAQHLSLEAQNAALKLLEETPVGCYFILTAPSASSILPTIASRSWQLPVLPVSLSAAQKYFKSSAGAREITSAWNLSGGAAGLLSALLLENNEHTLRLAVDRAKEFLSVPRYQRLLMADSWSGNADDLALSMQAISKVVTVLHHQAINQRNESRSRRLLQSRQLLMRLSGQLDSRANSRLTALSLALQLKI